MNRILKRPMFRMGGSTGTGITSGLDKPKRGLVDEPGGYAGDPFDRAKKVTTRYMQDPQLNPQGGGGFMPGSLSNFLTSFGLDMLSRPPTGNIFQTAAQSAKGPFETYQAAKLTEQADRRDAARDVFSGALASEYDILEQREKGKYGDMKTPELEAKLIRDAQQNIFDATAIKDSPDSTEEEILAAEQKIKINQNVLQKELGVPAEYAAILGNAEVFDSYKADYIETENQRREDEYKAENPDATPEEIVANVEVINVNSAEASDFTIAKLKQKYGFASGGRVGLAFGTKPAMMESVVEAEQETGEVQDLSFTELRSRLPQEISNDIIQLLANSKEALMDFANIKTSEDIAQFNQQYDVNLTLPQGA